MDLITQATLFISLLYGGKWMYENMHLIENNNIGPAAEGEETFFK